MSRNAASGSPEPSGPRVTAWAAGLLPALLLAAVLLLAGGLVFAAPTTVTQGGGHRSAIDLSRGVTQSLLHLQEVWLYWISAFYQNDRPAAATQVADLRNSAARLGFSRLPELSIAASVRAIEVSRQGDLARAEWALDDAEALDPGRAETSFGRAIVAREGGRHAQAVWQQVVGYGRLLRAGPHGLVVHGLVLAALAMALLAGGCFVLVQLAAKGSQLYWAVASRVARRLPPLGAHAVTVALLLWPLALPGGMLWTLLYWSVLLWSFTSVSERAVTGLLWALVAVAPFIAAYQQQRLAILLSPPSRAIEALAEGRLYGALFTDLGVLPAMLPESPAVRQLLADLHRVIGQWEEARILYDQVLEREPNNVTALLDLGAYHFRRGDHGNAVRLFQRAAAADPTSAAAYYNLSQAHSEAYQFAEQRTALARARALDEARVTRWIQDPRGDRVITYNGGLLRRDEIVEQVRGAAPVAAAKVVAMRRWLPPAIAAVALLLALALHRVLPRRDAPSPPRFAHRSGGVARVVRLLLPGLRSAEEGNGGRTYLSMLVVALVVMLLGGSRVLYPVPIGLQPGDAGPLALAIGTLVAFYGGRFWRDLRS
jgi:tetratricopeptide (TPR) repeat protein